MIGGGSVPILATLFPLSNAKLFCTIISAIFYTTLFATPGKDTYVISKAMWCTGVDVDYLGSKHALLFVIAVATHL